MNKKTIILIVFFGIKIDHVILVKYKTDRDYQRANEKQLFETIEFFDEIRNLYARGKGTRIFILKNTKIDVNEFLRERVNDVKPYCKNN